MHPNPIALSARVEILKAQSAAYMAAMSELESRLDKLKDAYLTIVSDPALRKDISDAIALSSVEFNSGMLNVILTQSGLADVISREECAA